MTSSDLTSSARVTLPAAAPVAVRPVGGLEHPASPPVGAVSATDVVSSVTGAVPVVVTVTAVVVTRGASPYLARTLAAVRAQTSTPDAVVVVDASGAGGAGARDLDLRLGDARFVAAPRARSFGDAVDVALANHDAGTWLWLLHDDSAPAPDALAELLRAVEHTSAVAVAGPKQERWDPGAGDEPADPFEPGTVGRLVEAGFTTTPLGRRMTGIDEDEIDQGQHDARDDVLAVGLAGSLVRRTVWHELGGTDPELGPFGDGLDLCRRARLAGHRVVVVPSAVVRHVQASLLGLRDRAGRPTGARPDPDASSAARRRSHLHARLVHVAGPWVPLVALAMVVGAPFHAMYRLLVKQPGQARDERVAPRWALVRVGPLVRARRRARRTRRLPRAALRPLRGTWREVLAERRDRRLARAELRRTVWAPTDIERREMRALAVRRRTGLGLVLATLAGLTAVVFGPLLGTLAGGGRLVGGALLPAGSAVGDLWRAVTTGWVTTGLGAPVPADPFVSALLPAALLAGGSAQTALDVLVPACLVVAGTGAWFAAGALTRSVPLRGWAVVVWVASPGLLGALGSGRVGGLLAHAALPWLALGVVRALGLQRVDVLAPAAPGAPARAARPEPGSLAAAAAAGLAFAVVVAGAPVLLPAGVLALVVVALGVRGHRRYLALVPVPALVLFAPYLVHALRTWADGGWRLLVAGPGAPVAADAAPAWQQLLGMPVAPVPWFGLDDGGAIDVLAGWAPYGAGGVVVVLAAVAVLRGRRVAVGAWFVAALGLAAGIVAGSTTVAAGTGSGPAVTGWAGPGVSLALLALLGAALAGLPRLPGRGAPAWSTGSVAAIAVVVTVLPLGGLAAWTADVLDRPNARVGEVRATAEPVVPPVGRQAQTSPAQARVLTLEPGADGVVAYAALRGDGPQTADASSAVQVRRLADPGATQGTLPEVVAELAAGTSDDVATRLAHLGVGAVLVPAAVPDDPSRAALVARLDMVPGLERMTEGRPDVTWRVAPVGVQPAYARVETESVEPVALAADRTALRPVDTRVDPGTADRLVVLAEDAAPGWRATLDGRALVPVEAPGGLQAFELGPEGGHLAVWHAADHRSAWLVVAGVVLLVYVLLAVPVRRRRPVAR
ncbi:glycosyltransferase [Cellulosimicrobium marinum]|uniref:glycosyltransferase n=1 Tax=Cellulosimicrobium marinum TaxID=1638992 RepID=UPI001E3604B1|nr:glycosyltransferase [Cellulosimicrobium marinum]MCB7137172.1 glycosyltransferase [Cellulosimicrobium marinum]